MRKLVNDAKLTQLREKRAARKKFKAAQAKRHTEKNLARIERKLVNTTSQQV